MMVNPAMVAAMRITADNTMSTPCVVTRATLADDGFGTKTGTQQQVGSGVMCRVQEIPRTPWVDASVGVKQERANHMIKVPWGTDIQAGDVITVTNDHGGTSTFEVDSPYNDAADGGTSSYYCYKKS